MVRYLAFGSQFVPQSITSFVNWSQKESIILSASYDLILRVNDNWLSAYKRDCLWLRPWSNKIRSRQFFLEKTEPSRNLSRLYV